MYIEYKTFTSKTEIDYSTISFLGNPTRSWLIDPWVVNMILDGIEVPIYADTYEEILWMYYYISRRMPLNETE